jgi:DNA-binding transcriptional LysR family regulator
MDKRRQPRLSLDLLRGFRAAARHLSFTRAADELSVTQSAISREIKTLEEQIGQPLFHRAHRALQLTAAGEELYRAADAALADLDTVVARLAGSGRTLAVTTTNALASLWLAPRLPGFSRLHPRISVRVASSNDRADLDRDRIDVAIQFAAAGDEAPKGERLFRCETFPVCAPALARSGTQPAWTPADLARCIRLDFETLRAGRWFSEWDFWSAATGIALESAASTLRFSQMDQMLPAALAGEGVAIGALPHFVQPLRDGRLCAPFRPAAVAHRGDFFIVVRRDVAGDEAVGAFIEWLRAEARADEKVTVRSPRAGRTRSSGFGGRAARA